MANYVHNYLFCDNEAKERILSLSCEDLCILKGCYDRVITSIENNNYLVIFDTRGMEYRTEFITKFIQKFNGTKWYCIEENELEQVYYFWNGSEVGFIKRRLVETLNSNEICLKYSDSTYRPLRIIFISDVQIIFENILKNEMKRYQFSEKTKLIINEYIDSMLNEVSEDFIERSTPAKNGIRSDISIHWGNKSYHIESFEEEDDWQLNVDDGGDIFDDIISFFNSILYDEGIGEVVSFDLQGKRV